MGAQPDLAHVDVRYVADLARLALSAAECARFEQELADILAYVGQLKELDVTGIEPTAHATRRVNAWRDDTPGATLPRERVLGNAPATVDDAAIRVPAMLEEEP